MYSPHPGRFSRALVVGVSLLSTNGLAEDRPPVVTVLALDTSGSLSAGDLARARVLALKLLESLPAGGEVAVFTFDDESRLVLPRTSDADAVRRAVSQVKTSGRYTALHDAIYDTSRYLAGAPPGRKGIVLLTDGLDENSALNLDDGLRLAQELGIPVVAVGVGRVQERVLRRIAKLTGGRYLTAQQATGPGLAALVLESSGERTPSAGPSAGVRTSPPGASPAVVPDAPSSGRLSPPAPEPESRRNLVTYAAVGGTVAVGALALLVLKRRLRHRCPSCGRELSGPLDGCVVCGADDPSLSARATIPVPVSDTVLERLSSTEEYLEKTVTLRERPVLAITRGPTAGEMFPLSSASTMSVGRAKANDIVLDDVAVSSQHCRIRPEDGRFVVHDLKSTNGTFVNDRRITRHALVEGDVIKIGETWLQFRTDQLRE